MVEEKLGKRKKEVAEGLGNLKKLGGLPKAKKKPEPLKTLEVPKKAEVPGGKGDPDVVMLKKQLEEEKRKTQLLENEKKDLEEKRKGLAKIIEKVSSRPEAPEPKPSPPPEPVEPKLNDLEKKLTEQFQSQLKEIKEGMTAIGTKMEKTAKPEDGKVKKLVDKIQSETSSKISALEDTMKRISDRFTSPEVPSKGGEEVSKGLAAFGGNVELQSDLNDVKKSLKDLERTFVDMRDDNETRFSRIKEQMKRIEKLPSLEEKLQALIEKLGPENIEKLKKLVFSTEELSNQVIPQEISKGLSKEISPVLGDVKTLKEEAGKLSVRIKKLYNEMSYFKSELKNLYRLGDYVVDLQTGREKMKGDFKERESKLLEKISGLEIKLKEKSEELSERIKLFKKDYSDFVEEMVRKMFTEMVESRLSDVKDKTSKELVSFKDGMDIVNSRFYKFENEISPAMETLKERVRDLEKVVEKVKGFQEKLDLNVEKSIEKKFTDISKPALSGMEDRISKTFETVNGRVDDMESELSQFRDVVNPTLEMFKGDLEKFEGRLGKINEFQSNLSDKIKEIKDDNKDIAKNLDSLERVEGKIEILDEKAKDIDDLKGTLDTRIGELDRKLKTLDERLSEQKKVLERIGKIEKVMDDFSVEISKLTDGSAAMEKRIEDNKSLFEESLDDLKDEKSQFENVVKPSLEMFKNDLGGLADSVQAAKEAQLGIKEGLKEARENDRDLFKRLGRLESYIQDISQLQKGMENLESSRKSFADRFEKMSERVKNLGERISSARKSIEVSEEKWKDLKAIGSSQDKMGSRMGRLEKELATMRAQFDNVVEQSLMDRKKLEEMSKKQKERINSLLSELRG